MDFLQLEYPVVSSFFICPISLQIMKDPVTISTGMTFDRESIQKWLFSYNHITCPITKQPLSDFSLIPNSNLLRLIRSWQEKNPPSETCMEQQQQHENDDFMIQPLSLLLEEMKKPYLQVQSLRKIKALISNRPFLMGDDVLYSSVASLVVKSESDIVACDHPLLLIDEAMSVLCILKSSKETLKMVSENGNGRFIDLLCAIMTNYSYNQARIQAAVLLNSIFKVVDGIYKEGLKSELFESVTEILKDQNSKQGTMAVLTILMEVLPFGKNKEKAIKGGLIPVLVELLAESNERRACEMMLVILEKLCRKAEGRADFLAHPAGLAVVLSKISRVSHVGNDKAISLLLWVFRFCKSRKVAEEFMELGGVAKVFILGFHKKTWRKSPCFPSFLRA